MVTVMAWETAVHYRRGVLHGVLGPGRHRLWGFGHRVHHVDTRVRLLEVATQEVLTADGTTVKVSAACRVRVVEPVAHIQFGEEPEKLVYETIKTWLRETVRPLTVEDLAAGVPVEAVPDAVASVAAEVGISVESLTVRDIIVPAAIRRAAEDLLTARRQSQVELERARSEVAVLRALANTTKLLADSPQLAALRLVDTAASHGASIIIERPAPTP